MLKSPLCQAIRLTQFKYLRYDSSMGLSAHFVVDFCPAFRDHTFLFQLGLIKWSLVSFLAQCRIQKVALDHLKIIHFR